jgi:hypothetical protein
MQNDHRYQKVAVKIWQDEKFVGLSHAARYLFLYALTNQHKNIIGVYSCPVGYMMIDTGMEAEAFNAAFSELLKCGLLEYCPASCVLWIKNHLKYNSLYGPKQQQAAINVLNALPKSAILRRFSEWLNGESLYPGLSEAVDKMMKNHIESAPDRVYDTQSNGYAIPYHIPNRMGMPYPMERVSDTQSNAVTVSVSESVSVSETEIVTGGMQGGPCKNAPGKKPRKAETENDRLAREIVALYRQKVKPAPEPDPTLGEARRHVKRILDSERMSFCDGDPERKVEAADLIRAVENVALENARLGTGPQFAQRCRNFFGRQGQDRWRDYARTDWTPPPQRCKDSRMKPAHSGLDDFIAQIAEPEEVEETQEGENNELPF